jgi:hypothetical protein
MAKAMPPYHRTGPLGRAIGVLLRERAADTVGGRGILVRRFGDSLAIESAVSPAYGQQSRMALFRVKSESGDYLTCRTWHAFTESEGPADVYVAKPYILQRTPFDGVTITYPSGNITYTYTQDYERSANDGTDTKTQVVTPRYYVNEVIVAARGIAGGTGITVSESNVVWQDINTCGRMWAVT